MVEFRPDNVQSGMIGTEHDAHPRMHMLKKFYYAIVGDPNEKLLKSYQPIVEEINALEAEFTEKSTEELKAMTESFKARVQSATAEPREHLTLAEQQYMAVLGTDDQKFARVELDRIKKEMLAAEAEMLDEILPEAFAAVREASKRTIGLRHYDVQLLGGMVLHSGTIAERRPAKAKPWSPRWRSTSMRSLGVGSIW